MCVIVHLVGSITGDTFTYYNMMAIYWVFLGIVASMNVPSSNDNEAGGQNKKGYPREIFAAEGGRKD